MVLLEKGAFHCNACSDKALYHVCIIIVYSAAWYCLLQTCRQNPLQCASSIRLRMMMKKTRTGLRFPWCLFRVMDSLYYPGNPTWAANTETITPTPKMKSVKRRDRYINVMYLIKSKMRRGELIKTTFLSKQRCHFRMFYFPQSDAFHFRFDCVSCFRIGLHSCCLLVISVVRIPMFAEFLYIYTECLTEPKTL